MDKNKSLIDVIAERSKVTYLSDMKLECFYPNIFYCICKMDKNEYSEKEWAKVYCYLSGESISELEFKDVYEKLLDYLLKNKSH